MSRIFIYFIIIQALLLALHFFTIKKPNLLSNRILGYLLVCFAVSILAFRAILDLPRMHLFMKLQLYITHMVLNFSMYPLLFLYIQAIYRGKSKLGRRSKQVHGAAFIVYFVFSQVAIREIPTVLKESLGLYAAINAVKVVVYFTYLILVFSYLRKQHGSFSNFFASQKNPNVSWLIVLLGSFIFLWLTEFFIFLSIILGIVSITFNITIAIAVIAPFLFVNAILIMALKKPAVFYANTTWSMREDDQDHYLSRFIELMEKEELYKDSELTLHKVSGMLQINPKYLSLILNKHMHGSFPDIVNKYRIETSKKLLENGHDMTIQQIMYDVGYNSKSAFHKHFKRMTGHTPGEYKEKHLKN